MVYIGTAVFLLTLCAAMACTGAAVFLLTLCATMVCTGTAVSLLTLCATIVYTGTAVFLLILCVIVVCTGTSCSMCLTMLVKISLPSKLEFQWDCWFNIHKAMARTNLDVFRYCCFAWLNGHLVGKCVLAITKHFFFAVLLQKKLLLFCLKWSAPIMLSHIKYKALILFIYSQ